MLMRNSMINLMNRLDSSTRAQIANCLIEDCSIHSTIRITGAAKKTVTRALVEARNVSIHVALWEYYEREVEGAS